LPDAFIAAPRRRPGQRRQRGFALEPTDAAAAAAAVAAATGDESEDLLVTPDPDPVIRF
jgi:hypothetical protein